MKKILCLLLILLMVACSNNPNDDNSNKIPTEPETPNTSTDEELEWDINEMMNDKNALGQYGKLDNENRYPDDEIYELIKNKVAPLKVNETYVEDFEKDDLYKRFYPVSVDDGVAYSYETNNPNSIDGTSLMISSVGNYFGVVFGGMKFAKNSTYKIKFDYKIIDASNDFFFQFRSSAGGVETDIYETISGTSGACGTIERTFYLGDHTDYQVMIFPRNDAGKLVIDNVEFSRLNSKPRIISCTFTGDLNANKTVSYEYLYYDPEGDLEKKTESLWYVSLDKNGKNKELIATNTSSVNITNDMVGKYLAVSLKPISDSGDNNSEGDFYTFYSKNVIGGESVNTGSTINLDFNQSFTEDFERDTNVDGNIYFNDEVNSYSYITSTNPLSGNRSMYISSSGSYGVVRFGGIKFQANGIYEITFDYKFITKGDNFYIQLRSDSAGYSHDKFFNVDMSQVTVNQKYQFKGQFALDSFSDYYLMMFPSAKGYELVLDNLKIKRIEAVNTEVTNKELNVGEYIEENFDNLSALKIGLDNSQTPNSKTTEDSDLIISGGSLYFESAGGYKCLYINKGIKYVANASYKVEFDYKVLSFVDTLYFQFNANGSTVFTQFGGFNQVGTVNHFEHTFKLGNMTNYVIQIFPGSSLSTSKVIIDNLKITRIS